MAVLGLVLAGGVVLLALSSRSLPAPLSPGEDATPTPTSTPTPSPTPTPTPTPTPVPAQPADCYEPRAAETEFPLFPASDRSIFQSCQVIAYYGYPGYPALGILGEYGPQQIGEQLSYVAEQYDAVNGSRRAVGALHLIAAVAQDSPGADGTHLNRMPGELIEQYIAIAEQYDLLVFLDLQIGTSSVAAEVEHVLPYLRHPRVHLALDPEWTMPAGVTPGSKLGSMDASAINHAQHVLQQVVDETGLPSKVLIVHQFTESMITNKASLERLPGVDLVIDMDGFGSRAVKLDHYQAYVVDQQAPHGGIKLFIDEDVNMFQPHEVVQIAPQPDYVQYQ